MMFWSSIILIFINENYWLDKFIYKNKKIEYLSNSNLLKRCQSYLKKERIYMNPPISLDMIHEFEKKHDVELPNEYVQFLTMIGDGSKKSPWYIKKIHSLSDYDDMIYLSQPFFIQTQEDYDYVYKDVVGKYKSYNRNNPIWNYLEKPVETKQNACWLLPQFQTLKGCIPLMDKGNASPDNPHAQQYFLILNGQYKGQVWHVHNWAVGATNNALLDGLYPN